MRAWVLEDIGNIKLHSDYDITKIASDEVLIKVQSAGICGSDINRVYRDGAHVMPLIIGHEFAGEVVKTGADEKGFWQGKRVGIFPLIPCKKCSACKMKKYEMCESYSYLGSRINGGFAEYVAVPKWNLIELPLDVTYEQAAMLEPLAVAIHAVRRMDMDDSSHVAICGIGTIGQLLIMVLMQQGIKNITAICNKASDIDKAKTLGISGDNIVLFDELISKAISPVDVYFDCVGKKETVTLGTEICGGSGQICLVGNPNDNIEYSRNQHWKILRKQLTIRGTWNSSFLGVDDEDCINDDWNYALSLLDRKLIHPENLITHRLNFDKLDDGLNIMKNKTETYTKIMINM